MPSSGRKGKTRTRRAPATAEVPEASDVETPEALATPTRGSRKRVRGADAPAQPARNIKRKTKDTRPQEPEHEEGTEVQERSDNDTEAAMPTEQEIISSLRVADKQVNATEDFANNLLEGQENVPGYGKIAGRDWVFIIRKVEVNIGRPEAQERLGAAEEGSHHGTPTARTVIDIDLGPDRQISRLHAVITYDPDTAKWFIIVNGRNGLRVDNNLYKRGARSYLRNGSVIEIANTQMAFITTATEDSDGPEWDASIIKQAQKSSEEDDEGEDDPRNTKNQVLNHASRGQLQATGVYQSSYSGQDGTHHQHQQRTHPHSQRAAITTPGTPMRSQPDFPKSSPAANYARGVMMESTESIDYSQDSAKDLKPPHSYAQLIGMAILSTTEQQMTLSNIYKWIMANYAFYRFTTNGWQNSIRHNLSLNKAFTKIARRTDEPGKGMKWMIEPSEFDTFVQQGMKGCRRPNPLPGTQSTLGSPNSPMDRVRPNFKRDDDTTPPLSSYHQAPYPTAIDTFTPERGSRRALQSQHNGSLGLGISGDLPEFDLPNRSTPRNGMTAAANAAGSPPALYVNEEGRVGPLDTPFPVRPSQRLAPPSTLRRPSDFIQFSSPAPFWKMDGLVGSTPFKPFDLSPLKAPFPSLKKDPKNSETDDGEDEEDNVGGDIADDDDDDDGDGDDATRVPTSKASPVVSSSSPPRSAPIDGSPTLSRPASAVTKTLSHLASVASKEHAAANPSFGNVHKDKVYPSSADLSTQHAATQHYPNHTHPAGSTPTTSAPPGPARPATATTTNGGGFSQSPPLTSASTQSFASTFPAAAPPPTNSFHHHLPSSAATVAAAGNVVVSADEGEDEGIDLAKGFQPIGSFHQRNHLAMSMGMAGGGSFGR